MKIATILSSVVALVHGQTTRIIGGTQAPVGKHRYISRLIGCDKEDSSDCDWICGGNLIAPNAILTAAHCILDDYPIKWVVVGSHFATPADGAAADGFKVGVTRAIRHPNYDEITTSNDAAILLLNRNISEIEPVQVSFHNVPKNVLTWARAWGTTNYDKWTPTDNLLEVQLKTWSNRDAAKVYANLSYTDWETNETVPYSIDSTMLAAGGVEGKDTCYGDSGGPLTIECTDKPAKLVGLTSWGHECALAGVPGLYTRLSAVKNFILSHCKQSRGNRPCKDCNFAQCYA